MSLILTTKLSGVKRDRPKGPQKRKLPSRPNSMLISSGDQGAGEEEEEQPSINLLGQPESKTQSPPPPEEDEQEVPRTGLKLRRVTDLPGTSALSRNMSAQYDTGSNIMVLNCPFLPAAKRQVMG